MRLAVCRKCGKPITFAVVANKAGKPPSRMPLDPTPNPDGNVAVYKDATGSLVGRVVGKGGDHLGYERLMMPHFATCEKRADINAAKFTPPPEGATFLAEFRKAKSAQAAAADHRLSHPRKETMKIYYDTEFLEDGRTISLISIGIVTEDGRELYLVNEQADLARIMVHEWLLANVVPSLPLARDRSGNLHWNTLHPDAKAIRHLAAIAVDVREFIQATPDPELWAWYGAYDHVALCQLWGPMVKLPEGVPMWTNDLKQEAERLGNPELPSMPGVAEHNALSDAREVRFRAEWLAADA